MEKQLEFTLELGRPSVIYAEGMFTVYITVKNMSKEKLYLWDLNVYPSAEFKFKRRGESPNKITITEQLKKFISNFSSPIPVQKEETLPKLTEQQVQQKAKEDMLKVYYYDQIRKTGLISRVLCPGEAFTEYFLARTKKSLFFRPDKYRFVMWADYSNQKDDFIRESQSKEVDVLVSMNSIIIGAIFGGILGALARLLSTTENGTINFPSPIKTGLELFGAVIISVLAVVAFARKSSAQTLITIPDFWGGIFVGFLAGYSGKTFIEKYILPTA